MLKRGDLTNKGIVKMIDDPWSLDGIEQDVLVITDQGPFRKSELVQIEKCQAPEPDPLKELVQFNDVMKVDIRPGKVINAERVPKTDKLIHLKVETSLGQIDIITNLGAEYEANEFLNKTFMFVLNMPPVMMKGIESKGMILASDSVVYDSKENIYKKKIELVEVKIGLNGKIL